MFNPKLLTEKCTSSYSPKIFPKLEVSYKPEVVMARTWGVLKTYSTNASKLEREYDLLRGTLE